jgi:hypothetical protein
MEMFLLFLGIALLTVGGKWAKAGFPGLQSGPSAPRRIPVAYRVDPEQRKAALEAYKHAVSEKMDVMRTAIQMGWGDDELKRLDERLEQLIGKDDLKRLLDGELSSAPSGAQDMNPADEISRLRQTSAMG